MSGRRQSCPGSSGPLEAVRGTSPWGWPRYLSARSVPGLSRNGNFEELPPWRTLGGLTKLKRLVEALDPYFGPHFRRPRCRTLAWVYARIVEPRPRAVVAQGCGAKRERWANYYRLLGGSMRIGNRLGGAVVWAIVATASATGRRGAGAAERVQPVPLGGSLADQSGDRHFGVYVPTRFGGELTIKTSSGTVGKITGPDGRERQNGQEVGDEPAGLVHLHGDRGRRKPYYGRDHVRPGRPERRGSPGTSITGRPRPTRSTSPGPAATAGSTRCRPCGDDQLVATPGGYIAPGQDIVRAGPNGLLETPVAAGRRLDLVPQPLRRPDLPGRRRARSTRPPRRC